MIRQRKIISLLEARELLKNIPINQEKKNKKPLLDCLGEVLAEDVIAPFPFPFFRRSGYDGFGLTAETDSDFPKHVDVVGEIGAGTTYNGHLKKNQVIRIMTGAQVPDGVVKIIPLEKTRSISEERIELLDTETKSNITPIGHEFQEGDCLLSAGTRLTAGRLSLLAAFGIDTVVVQGKVRVGLLTTGSELLEIGTPIEPGKIYNSNRILLEGLVKEAGAELLISESVSDDLSL